MRSLVVQTSFLGDVILTTPLIARLAIDGDVDVVTTPGSAPLLATHPAISRLIIYDKRGRDNGVSGFARVAREARGATHCYLAQGSVRSAALALAAGCPQRTGFTSSAGGWLYTERIEYRDDWHHARRLLSLADVPLAATASDTSDTSDLHGPSDAAIQPRLYPSEADITAVDMLLMHRSRPVITIAPGSVWATKRWPGFAALARLLAADHDVAIIGSAQDTPAAADIALALPPDRLIDATGKLSLLASAELIRRSLVLVTNDSSPQHLASAMGTPTVTLFGPTVPAFGFGPLAPGSRTIGLDGLACRPCDRHGPQRCPLGHWRCMNDITPNQVSDMVRSVIAAEVVR